MASEPEMLAVVEARPPLRQKVSPMPRYFFDTDDGDLGLVDREGQILADDATARAAAMHALSDMLRDHVAAGETRVFSVRNEQDRLIFAGAVALATG